MRSALISIRATMKLSLYSISGYAGLQKTLAAVE